MTFRASNQIPANAYDNAKNEALRVKNYCQLAVSKLQNSVTSSQIIKLVGGLSVFIERLSRIKSIAGITAYAKEQEVDQNYDVVAEFNSLVALIEDSRDWVVDNFPKDANGYLLSEKWDNKSSGVTERTFNTAATADFVTKLKAVVDQVS